MFYKPSNKIIIVDDSQADLDTLSKEFHQNGIGCMSYEYSTSYSSPLKDVRIAFFDIDINPSGGGSDSQRFNSLATAIKQYVHKDNGPFALIFWTKKTEDIQRLSEYISNVHSDCPKPFLVDGIDKADFVTNPQEILEKVLGDDTLELLFNFEYIASKSASSTINQIYTIIPSTDNWGGNKTFKENFEKIFSKIANSALGFAHAKKNPDRAVYEALVPVLNYHITIAEKNNKWGSYLKSLSSSQKLEIPDFNIGLLNSIFHIDTPLDIDKTTRGAVFEFQFEVKGDVDRFKYFNALEQQTKDLFNKFIQFVDEIPPGEKDAVRGKSKFIIIEISSACDFSQNKSRNHKYVLGLITPHLKDKYIDYGKMSDAVYYRDLPVINFEDVNYNIWINFNFSFSDFNIHRIIGRPFFVFKKEIMDMIGNRYANHVSRIGITCF